MIGERVTNWLMVTAFLLLVWDANAQQQDWPAYLGGHDSGQYSSLNQVTANNVAQLERAWEFRTGEKGQMQCNPIVVDGILYATTAKSNLFALDAATGEKKWSFNPREAGYALSGSGTNRGVTYWADGDERRILYSSAQRLFSVDAMTGKPVANFGDNGAVNLRDGLGLGDEKLYVISNSPGIIYENVIIMGTRVNEAHPAAPGHIRAYDVRTGNLAWTFHTIPQPGEFGHDTWPADAWKRFGGANAWAGMSLDEERGIVYVPTGSAAYDFYGGDRPGNNLFANCLLALNAETGERIWHYQFVRHDLWDRDLPAPPNLVTVTIDGKQVDAVAQITKSAHVFLFDRETGEPLYPIEEHPAPKSDLPGEWTAPTQPLPTRPPAFAREFFTEEEITNRTPEAHDHVLNRLKRYRTGQRFLPPSREGTVILPGFDGGGEWGGAAVDPDTGIMYVNNSEMAWVLTMVDTNVKNEDARTRQGRRSYARHCLYCHGVDMSGDPLQEYPSLKDLKERLTREESEIFIRAGKEKMPSFDHVSKTEMTALLEYLYAEVGSGDAGTSEAISNDTPHFGHTGYTRFVDPDGYPAMKPPWGSLNAIDLNKGEILWKVTLGHEPGVERINGEPTGTENYGGPVVTAGGLIFIAATKDAKLRAFDKDTGEELWAAPLPFSGYATPAVYMAGGKQYIAVAAGGGKIGTEPGDAYVAFSLPD